MNMCYSSLQDHENPVDGRLYSSLQEHGIPINPVPGRLYSYPTNMTNMDFLYTLSPLLMVFPSSSTKYIIKSTY